MSDYLFEQSLQKISANLKKYRDIVAQDTCEQFAENMGLPAKAIFFLEQGMFDAVSARDFLKIVNKMELLNGLVELLDNQEDTLELMADFIAGLEKDGPL